MMDSTAEGEATDWMNEHSECEHMRQAMETFWVRIVHAQEAIEGGEDCNA